MGIFEIFAIPFGYIMWACYQLVKNYGVAIILFTLLTKILLIPLSIKQQKSSAKSAYLKPKLDALQAKYGNNREKLAQEQQKLYEEEGYNPMSGCLPLLIQFPVLFGVIGVVYKPLTHVLHLAADTVTQLAATAEPLSSLTGKALEKMVRYPELLSLSVFGEKTAEFTAKINEFDPAVADVLGGFNNTFLGIDFSAIPSYTSWLILIPILAAVVTFLSSFVSMRSMKTPDGSAPAGAMGKGMTFIMPIITFFFAMGLPCGIGFYWIVSSLFGMGQSVLLAKFYNPQKLAEQIAAEQAAKKEKAKAKKQALAEERRRIIEERQANAAAPKEETPLTPEEAEEKRQRTEEALRKLNEARRRDAEKYGERFVEATEDDLRD